MRYWIFLIPLLQHQLKSVVVVLLQESAEIYLNPTWATGYITSMLLVNIWTIFNPRDLGCSFTFTWVNDKILIWVTNFHLQVKPIIFLSYFWFLFRFWLIKENMSWCLIIVIVGLNPSKFITGTEWVLLAASCPAGAGLLCIHSTCVTSQNWHFFHYKVMDNGHKILAQWFLRSFGWTTMWLVSGIQRQQLINHPLPILFTHIIPKIIVPLKFLVSTGIPVVCGVDNSSHKLAGEKMVTSQLHYFISAGRK